MVTTVSTNWVKDMLFDAELSGHHLLMDLDTQVGGEDKGPRPKPLILAALSGCSGMDVVSILEKMRVKDYQFKIDVAAESTTEHPITYHTINVDFHFEGSDLPNDKVYRAVELSTTKYCGVMAMLRKAAQINVKVYVNGLEVTP